MAPAQCVRLCVRILAHTEGIDTYDRLAGGAPVLTPTKSPWDRSRTGRPGHASYARGSALSVERSSSARIPIFSSDSSSYCGYTCRPKPPFRLSRLHPLSAYPLAPSPPPPSLRTLNFRLRHSRQMPLTSGVILSSVGVQHTMPALCQAAAIGLGR